ncbi:MAG: MFS transporter [Rhodospirillaceae bacterium]
MSNPGFHAIKSALANDNYRYYAAGNVLSHFGTWIQRVGMGWLAWELTRSPFWLGAIGFADMVPAMILAPFAGAIADRVNRLRGIQFTQFLALLQAVVLALLAFSGTATIWWLFWLALFRGIVMSFNQPMRFSILPSLVERKDLPSAIAINSISFNLARSLGPVLASGIIAIWGVGMAFSINAISFLIFIISLLAINLSINPHKEKKPLRNIPHEILEGMRYCMQTSGIAQVFIILAVVALFGRAFAELLPGFADGVFGWGVQGLGYFHAAMGCGAIMGSIYLARRGMVAGMTRITGASVLLLGVALILFAGSSNFYFAVICAGFAGLGLVMIGVGEQQLIQNSIDGAMRGRVMAFYGLMMRGGTAMGAMGMGLVGEWLGISWPVVIGGVVMLLLCAWIFSQRHFLEKSLEANPEEETFPEKTGFK